MSPSLPFDAEDPMGPTVPEEHYHISRTTRFSEDISSWLSKSSHDPAFAVSCAMLHIADLVLTEECTELEFP